METTHTQVKPPKAALLLLPNLLADLRHHAPFLPESVDRAVATIDGLIAESEAAGRRYLDRFPTKLPAREIPIALYDEKHLDFLLEPILAGQCWGMVSDAGLPCIADPGHRLVYRARQLGIQIKAFVGPSAMMLALMLSGLPGQRFAFHGYPPKDQENRAKVFMQMEKRSKEEQSTQIFMEAPYRNRHVLETACTSLRDDTLLSVVWELGTPDQGLLTQPVGVWKKSPLPNLDKKRALFLFSRS